MAIAISRLGQWRRRASVATNFSITPPQSPLLLLLLLLQLAIWTRPHNCQIADLPPDLDELPDFIDIDLEELIKVFDDTIGDIDCGPFKRRLLALLEGPVPNSKEAFGHIGDALRALGVKLGEESSCNSRNGNGNSSKPAALERATGNPLKAVMAWRLYEQFDGTRRGLEAWRRQVAASKADKNAAAGRFCPAESRCGSRHCERLCCGTGCKPAPDCDRRATCKPRFCRPCRKTTTTTTTTTSRPSNTSKPSTTTPPPSSTTTTTITTTTTTTTAKPKITSGQSPPPVKRVKRPKLTKEATRYGDKAEEQARRKRSPATLRGPKGDFPRLVDGLSPDEHLERALNSLDDPKTQHLMKETLRTVGGTGAGSVVKPNGKHSTSALAVRLIGILASVIGSSGSPGTVQQGTYERDFVELAGPRARSSCIPCLQLRCGHAGNRKRCDCSRVKCPTCWGCPEPEHCATTTCPPCP